MDRSACICLPVAAGIGLRDAHLAQVLRERPRVGWLEVHSENYLVAGGPRLRQLESIRADHALSLHGVGLSLGGSDPLDVNHLHRLADLVRRIEPAAVSEHLCWSSIDGRWINDLLPLPYSQAALANVCDRIGRVQDALGRRLLLENVSSYLRFLPEEMPEWAFCAEVARRSGCALLLDVNNIYVSASNHGFRTGDFLAGIPRDAVAEIHLAGHECHDGLLIDTHSRPVCAPVWELYAQALVRFGPQPTLIEWDQELPAFAVLQEEAARADALLAAARMTHDVRAA